MKFQDISANIKTTVKDCTDFAVNGITNICNLYGPRPCGGESETKAQETMLQELIPFSDEVRRETFKANPEAFMSFIPIAGSMCIGASALNAFAAHKKSKAALGSLALLGAGVAGIAGEFLFYKKVFDPFFKEKESGNVIAVRKATGETKRRIILSGHSDSAPEWTYTYKLGSHGAISVLAPAIAGLLYTGATAATALAGKTKAAKKMVKGQLAFMPAYAALYNFTNHKNYVMGANDDLTGCYVASAALKYLSDNDISFENTEVIAMLSGGEECGLRGSKAFFEAHPEYKNDGVETVFIALDNIRDADFMMIYEKDMSGTVANDIRVCNLLKRAAERNGENIPLGTIPLGSTDAAAASQAGIPAASIVAMDPAPARYYHTRLDTPDILVPECIEKILSIILDAVFDFDENGIN